MKKNEKKTKKTIEQELKRDKLILKITSIIIVILLILLLASRNYREFDTVMVSKNNNKIFSMSDLVIDGVKYGTSEKEVKKKFGTSVKEDKITKEYASGFVKLLNPIAPHITEEIWHTFLGHTDTIANETWPSYDETKITEDTYTMVVQVNGKLRGKIDVSSETSKEEMERLAKSIPNVISFIDGKEIVKVITVPKKLVNIVVK